MSNIETFLKTIGFIAFFALSAFVGYIVRWATDSFVLMALVQVLIWNIYFETR